MEESSSVQTNLTSFQPSEIPKKSSIKPVTWLMIIIAAALCVIGLWVYQNMQVRSVTTVTERVESPQVYQYLDVSYDQIMGIGKYDRRGLYEDSSLSEFFKIKEYSHTENAKRYYGELVTKGKLEASIEMIGTKEKLERVEMNTYYYRDLNNYDIAFLPLVFVKNLDIDNEDTLKWYEDSTDYFESTAKSKGVGNSVIIDSSTIIGKFNKKKITLKYIPSSATSPSVVTIIVEAAPEAINRYTPL